MTDSDKHAAQKKRKWLIPVIIAIVLLLAAVVFLAFRLFAPSAPVAYVPGNYPEGVHFADIVTEEELIGEDNYAAYDPNNDPAHPVLDVKVKLSISNLGSRPGEPRPQDIANEYPAPTATPSAKPSPAPTPAPSVTLKPDIVLPGLKPGDLPNVILPELYIIKPAVESPQFTGEEYKLSWEYTAGRKAVFAVSISADGGKTFKELKTGIDAKSYELTFPDQPAEHCVLRVSALVDGIVYKTAYTAAFVLTFTPESVPLPIKNYVDPQVQYVDIPGLRISSESGLPVWFEAENNARNAAKLIWQLSKIPFFGTQERFGTEAGILASGEIAKAGGEFSIDLKKLCEHLTKPHSEQSADQPFLMKQSVYAFYLRVVPLDENGDCIGDPGNGLSFSYGKPDIGVNSTSMADHSKIAVLMQMPVPYTSYSYTWERIAPGVYNTDLSNLSDRVLFSYNNDQEASELIRKAVRVELQVATSPFTNATVIGLAQPNGLVYSYVDTAPDIYESSGGYNYMTPWDHGLEYKQFIPSEKELDAMGGIYYYVRGIFYVPDSENPSVLLPYPSETLTIAFRVTPSYKNEVKQVTVRSDAPYVQVWGYTPVQWQAPDYDEYFEVTRHIEAEEMNFTIRNTKTGDFLMPYQAHINMYGWTRERYQAKLDEMLPLYSSFHYVKSEPGFWDEFFGLLTAIYKGVSNAYNNAKAAVVSLVDYIPYIGDTARGILKHAATYAINYGLAYIGLPPSLPNADLLAEEGMDYLIRMGVEEALSYAGLPEDTPVTDEITEQVRKRFADDFTNELVKAVVAQQQNPFRADFLRLSRVKLYEPAYVVVRVKNYSKTHTARAGWVTIRFGNSFDVYATKGASIPRLKPGESTTMYIYLDHLRCQTEGYSKSFDRKYYSQDGKLMKMYVNAGFDLPDVRVAAKEQGVAPAPLPYLTEYVYDHSDYLYERDLVPAERFWEPDPAADPKDFKD